MPACIVSRAKIHCRVAKDTQRLAEGAQIRRVMNASLPDIAAGAAYIEKFLCCFVSSAYMLTGFKDKLTMPVSAVLCCDWKNTASVSLQAGHCLFDRGNWE